MAQWVSALDTCAWWAQGPEFDSPAGLGSQLSLLSLSELVLESDQVAVARMTTYKWRSLVLWSYPTWQVKEPCRDGGNGPSLKISRPVRPACAGPCEQAGSLKMLAQPGVYHLWLPWSCALNSSQPVIAPRGWSWMHIYICLECGMIHEQSSA